ncbi:MAG: type II toxin-antitoxin system death-on-curing family toxin [Phycisphaerae bacterium]|nr:type II toxin-antitoxin system death-on-curing family toxin [Phycisphaerae bacterium]
MEEKEYIFLTVEQVIALNLRAIRKDGGVHGVLNRNLLLSATAMPRVTFDGRYLHESVAAMAGAYLFHVCQAHAFCDGNKRTAVLAAVVFLDLNAYGIEVGDDEFEELVLGVAGHAINKDHVMEFFEKHVLSK